MFQYKRIWNARDFKLKGTSHHRIVAKAKPEIIILSIVIVAECYCNNLDTLQVVTYKNHALDNFMVDCVKKVSSPDVKIVRVGRVREDANEELKKILLRQVWFVGHN